MTLFRRCDGDLLKGLDPVRRMMPIVMRGRNESIIYHTTQWDITKACVWLRALNQARGDKPQATLFHLVAYATAKTIHARPGLNRFVSGGRIYQRKGVWLSFAVKTSLTDDAPLTTIKLSFPQHERFDEFVDRITDAIKNARSGEESRIDREVRLLAKLPGPLLQAVAAAVRWLDRINLLPAFFIDPDPMYTSVFLVNLGSIHIDNAYHHLYEYGSCSLLAVVGGIRKIMVTNRRGRSEVRRVLEANWSFDDRVNDGFYCMESVKFSRRFIEDPGTYVELAGQLDGRTAAHAGAFDAFARDASKADATVTPGP